MGPLRPEGQRPDRDSDAIEVPRNILIGIGLESGAAFGILALTIGAHLAVENPSKLLAVPALIAAILAFDVALRIHWLKKK